MNSLTTVKYQCHCGGCVERRSQRREDCVLVFLECQSCGEYWNVQKREQEVLAPETTQSHPDLEIPTPPLETFS